MQFPSFATAVGLSGALALSGLVLAGAAEPDRAPPLTESSEGQWVFSFLPISLQKNPIVNQTVVTEMTPDGKRLPVPSPEKPVYYAAQAGGFRDEGPTATDESRQLAEPVLNTLRQALRTNGILPATPEHRPSVLLVYVWGQHSQLEQNSVEFPEMNVPDIGHKNLLSRASLVGGDKFAAELREALIRKDSADMVRQAGSSLPGTDMALFDPLEHFLRRDGKTRQLYEESRVDCYYVVALAYDYAAAAHGQRKLLWRTKMTVESQGVAMADVVPALITNASKYLGRDMPEAATMAKPVVRSGQVHPGSLRVMEYMDKPTPTPASPAPQP